jgi:hypothetical protein
LIVAYGQLSVVLVGWVDEGDPRDLPVRVVPKLELGNQLRLGTKEVFPWHAFRVRISRNEPLAAEANDPQGPAMDSPPSWDHDYHAMIGGCGYRWQIKSQFPLGEGQKFFLPLKPNLPPEQTFVRPILKPRQSPDFVHVRVERIDGDTLILARLSTPSTGSIEGP